MLFETFYEWSQKLCPQQEVLDKQLLMFCMERYRKHVQVYVPAIFAYIERHWVEQAKIIEAAGKRSSHLNLPVMRIGELVKRCWDFALLSSIQSASKQYIKTKLDARRMSIIQAGSSEELDPFVPQLLKVYREDSTPSILVRWSGERVLKICAMDGWYRDLVRKFATRLTSEIVSKREDSSELVQTIERYIQFETEMARQCLGQEVMLIVRPVLKSAVLEPLQERLMSVVQKQVIEAMSSQGSQVVTLRSIAGLFANRAKLTESMDKVLAESLYSHLSTVLFQHRTNVLDTICTLWKRSDEILRECFADRKGAKEARDKAFGLLINSSPNLRSSVPPLLAEAIMTCSLKDAEFQHDDSSLVYWSLFRLCAERESFAKALLRLCTKHLIFLTTAEGRSTVFIVVHSIFEHLKVQCGSAFVSSIFRLAHELEGQTSHLVSHLQQQPTISAMHVDMLTIPHGSWTLQIPTDAASRLSRYLPQWFTHSMKGLKQEYLEKHQGRKFAWHADLCYAHIKLYGHPFIVLLSFLTA